MNNELYNRIGAFATDKLKDATVIDHLLKALEEVRETGQEMTKLDGIANQEAKEEFADCFIALIGGAFKAEISYEEMVSTIETKLNVNLNSEWQKDAFGVLKRIKK